MAATSAFAEDELGRKWDKCLTDVVLKMGGGLTVGTVMSLLFFKRRKWPIILGTGFGIGMAYANCERSLNNSLCEPSPKASKEKK
ncbi:MICOS complex subunit MIC10 [Blattella germanica]|nr:MICOS complex subunit MIC10 [Blattella germanica]